MGQTAKIMTHIKATKVKTSLSLLLDLYESPYYYICIGKTTPIEDIDDWKVYLYSNHKYSSFLSELAALANSIQQINPQYRAGVDKIVVNPLTKETRLAVTLH